MCVSRIRLPPPGVCVTGTYPLTHIAGPPAQQCVRRYVPVTHPSFLPSPPKVLINPLLPPRSNGRTRSTHLAHRIRQHLHRPASPARPKSLRAFSSFILIRLRHLLQKPGLCKNIDRAVLSHLRKLECAAKLITIRFAPHVF